MPYRIDYPSDASPYMVIVLEDPFTDSEIETMRTELEPLTTTEAAHYVLADLRSFDVAQNFQRLLLATDGIPIPSLTGSRADSRLAMVGGGPAVALISQMMGKLGGGNSVNLLKSFKTLDEAEQWLVDEYNKTPPPN